MWKVPGVYRRRGIERGDRDLKFLKALQLVREGDNAEHSKFPSYFKFYLMFLVRTRPIKV